MRNFSVKTKQALKASIIPAIQFVDLICSKIALRIFPEKSSLLTFLFHGLFKDENEIKRNLVDPQQAITIDHFRQFIKYYLKCGFVFVSPLDITKGLDKSKRHILITFDDGYYNNVYALDVLNEFKVPAVFFFSTNQIKHNKCFWWDVVYREGKKRKKSDIDISIEQISLKSKTADKIEEYLVQNYGANALTPFCDIDRPLTVAEFKEFAKNEYVYIGNHTQNHAILTNYDKKALQDEIVNGQKDIFEISGVNPIIISYPNGSYNQDVLDISTELGLKLGITVDARKNYLPLDLTGETSVKLGRFVLIGTKRIDSQCEFFRSDLGLYNKLKNKFK